MVVTPCSLAATLHPLGIDIVGPRPAEMISARTFGGYRVKAFTGQSPGKKPKKRGKSQKLDTLPPNKPVLDGQNDVISESPPSADDTIQGKSNVSSFSESEVQRTVLVLSRGAVLQACTITSCLIGSLGVAIREVTHFAYTEGWPINDCSSEISFSFEPWHFELIAGLGVVVSSCRYLLLNTWTDFAESSEAANRQVLSSMDPLDYIIVAFLPGISEELLFRGALLPLFGTNWISVLAVAALFGVLHLGNGRNYSFTIWATLVGVAYGFATVASSSIIVPMASHALNNLVGGIMWRYSSNPSK